MYNIAHCYISNPPAGSPVLLETSIHFAKDGVTTSGAGEYLIVMGDPVLIPTPRFMSATCKDPGMIPSIRSDGTPKGFLVSVRNHDGTPVNGDVHIVVGYAGVQ